MNARGIRIWDKEDGAVSVRLFDILEEIKNGNLLHWSLLDLYAMGEFEEKSLSDLEDQITESEKGLFINWQELNLLSHKLELIIQIVIIGCYNQDLLHRYENPKEMYETCDVVIDLVDSNFWEVSSKDLDLISRLAKKFLKTEFLQSDYQKYFCK